MSTYVRKIYGAPVRAFTVRVAASDHPEYPGDAVEVTTTNVAPEDAEGTAWQKSAALAFYDPDILDAMATEFTAAAAVLRAARGDAPSDTVSEAAARVGTWLDTRAKMPHLDPRTIGSVGARGVIAELTTDDLRVLVAAAVDRRAAQ